MDDKQPLKVSYQSFFKKDLNELVPNRKRAQEIEKAVRFVLTFDIAAGKFVGNSAPVNYPVRAFPVPAGHNNPALIVYYCIIGPREVMLMSVDLADSETE